MLVVIQMDGNANLLIEEFKRISKKGWISSTSKSFGSIGITFEKELGKNADSMYFPDYYGIEIKCTSRFSKYPLYLFTVAFDGPTFPEIDRIVSKYGWYDKDFSDKKVLFAKLNYKEKNIVNYKYKFKLEFDEEKEKLYLCVYDLNDCLIEKESFVYTYSIYNHFNLKLSKLAIIHASTKKKDNEKYFRYYKIDVYKVISFEKFIELLEKDIIKVSLISRMNKSGIDKGRYRNKNLVFQIDKKNIENLFVKLYSYNSDLNN